MESPKSHSVTMESFGRNTTASPGSLKLRGFDDSANGGNSYFSLASSSSSSSGSGSAFMPFNQSLSSGTTTPFLFPQHLSQHASVATSNSDPFASAFSSNDDTGAKSNNAAFGNMSISAAQMHFKSPPPPIRRDMSITPPRRTPIAGSSASPAAQSSRLAERPSLHQTPHREMSWTATATQPAEPSTTPSVDSGRTSATPELNAFSFGQNRSESPVSLTLPSRHTNKSSPNLYRQFHHSKVAAASEPVNVPSKRSYPSPSKATSLPVQGLGIKAKTARIATVDKYNSISKNELDSLLSLPDSLHEVLVIDLRPHTKFGSTDQSHLQDSINLCAPTTLLRRPAFGLDRLADTLPDEEEQARFLAPAQQDSGVKTIVALDQDSCALFEDSPVNQLFGKYEKAGFQGNLSWVNGGYSSLLQDDEFMSRHKHSDSRIRRPSVASSSSSTSYTSSSDRIALGPRQDSSDSQTSFGSESLEGSIISRRQSSTSSSDKPTIQCRSLPSAAFDASSTQAHILGESKSNSSGGSGSKSKTKQCATNPFFETIRQNHECLSLESSLAHVKDVSLRPDLEGPVFKQKLPKCLKSLVDLTPKSRSHKLATEFYEVEAAEQNRLQKSMAWECDAANQQQAPSSPNPYSITAGLELGHLNRYKNIFPYDHARCRLQKPEKASTDYINASHITFSSCKNRSYIASQGPLPGHFEDFWKLVYQEQVGVVVMLTALKEGGRDKCGKYYEEGQHGSIHVACPQGVSGQDVCEPNKSKSHSKGESMGGFFSSFDVQAAGGAQQSQASSTPVARRTLNIQPEGKKARSVRHIKFGGWPDFDIPPDAQAVVNLIDEVNQANKDMAVENGDMPGPVLVHCSAGVGRTGSFMLIDVFLEMVRKSKGISTPTSNDQEEKGIAQQQLDQKDYLRDLVDEMRQQRMSMVANYAQYRFCHEAILVGLTSQLSLSPKTK